MLLVQLEWCFSTNGAGVLTATPCTPSLDCRLAARGSVAVWRLRRWRCRWLGVGRWRWRCERDSIGRREFVAQWFLLVCGRV